MSAILVSQTPTAYTVIRAAYKNFFTGLEAENIQVFPWPDDADTADLLIETEYVSEQQYGLFDEQERSLISSESIFAHLASQWRVERGIRSSTTEIVLCPSYQKIIGMGPVAIPLILAEMEMEGDDPDQWFWALQTLTGSDPVRDEDEGNFSAMAKSWIAWGRRGYIW